MTITFTDGTTKQVLCVVFDVILGRSMIGLIEKKNSEPLFQCVEEIEKIEDSKKFLVTGISEAFVPENNHTETEVVNAANTKGAKRIFIEMQCENFGIEPDEITIDKIRDV